MKIKHTQIDASSYVNDIVNVDYRTADIFRKYDIDFCCGGKWPLEVACAGKGLDTEKVLQELINITRQLPSTAGIEYDEWDLDFLADYILNVHHQYLKKALPGLKEQIRYFFKDHSDKFPELGELEMIFKRMIKEIPPHMQQEEEIIFPYIKQIYHACRNRESYASLLIRTLRKPVEEMMQKEHDITVKRLQRIRELTMDYTPPENACIKHRVLYAKLKELDIDLTRHIHLESNILFPKAIAIEKELLKTKE